MRRRRRVIALSLLSGLVENCGVARAFGTADGIAIPIQPIALRSTGGRSIISASCRCRPKRSSVRRRRMFTARDAAPSVTSGEHAFAAGGAEQVAELLAGEQDGEGAVFFNRVGALNRDLSVLMANVLAEERAKERLPGKKRKKRSPETLSTQPSPVDGFEHRGAARRRRRWGLKAVLKRATRRHSWRRHGGSGGGEDSKEEQEEREEKQEEEGDGLVVLDAFAASGVRALRYLTEVPTVRRVVANDYDAAAIAMIRKAADLSGAGNKLVVNRGDAIDTMYAARAGGLGTYDLVDIDPFGCAAGFLDAGVQAVTDGGLLCVTSTDMPVLSGAQPEVAWARYGSVPTRSGYHHEMSLRILLQATSAAAGRHRRSIEPVLSVAVDHYVRVFVRVSRSRKGALVAAQEKASYVLQSETCPSFFLLPVLPTTPKRSPRQTAESRPRRCPGNPESTAPLPVGSQREANTSGGGGADAAMTPGSEAPRPLVFDGVCAETGGRVKAGGPIWSGPLHNEAWVARAIAMASDKGTSTNANDDRPPGVAVPRPRLVAGARVNSILRAVSRELPDVPLFYNLRDMFATLGFKQHPRREQIMGALESAGYRASGMHKEPLALKTDAPDAAVWDVLRCWARDNPQPPPVRAAGLAILGRGTQLITRADFGAGRTGVDEGRAGGEAGSRGGFLHTHNPEQNWGPLARRSVMARDEGETEGLESPLAFPPNPQ